MANFSSTYPSTRPVFNADFSNAGRLDSRITFSRSDTPPTYAAPSAVHYWSNEKHLSSENLIPNSNTNAAWQTFDVTKSVSGSFLDGSDSLLVSETANTAIHYISPNVGAGNSTSFVSGTEYTAVMYAKAGTDNIIQVGMTSGAFGANAYANYDLSNAATPPVTGSSATATITALGSDWVKLTLTATATSSATGTGMFVAFTDNNINAGRAPGYAGDTAANVYLWEGNVSSTGQKHLVETNGQIHREYAPTLKSVSTAGQPRFEYSPTDSASEVMGQSRGLLIESASTNLITRSSELDQGFWSKSGINVEANAAVSVDGTLTADLLRSATTTGTHYALAPLTTVASSTYTGSAYLKAAGHTKVQVFFYQTASPNTKGADTTFTLTGSGSATTSTGSATINSVGGGYYRVSVTGVAGTTSTYFAIRLLDDSSNSTFTGDGYSGIICTGAQFELGSHASSLISTSGSAVTRAADSASMVSSSLFDNGGGTLYAEASQQAQNTYNGIFSVDDGSGSNIVQMFGYNSNFRAEISSGGTTVANMTAAGNSVNTFHKHAVSFSPSEAKYYVNGSQIGSTDTDLNIPTMSQIHLGELNTSGNHLNGHIKRVAVYSEPVSATNAAALTS